jgi:hypothetical protein
LELRVYLWGFGRTDRFVAAADRRTQTAFGVRLGVSELRVYVRVVRRADGLVAADRRTQTAFGVRLGVSEL